ncbi:NADPH:quinone reductase-like Zn-dependent oxidoreductase [Kineosphaera limosa]|uniref:Putative oxidoreductase n=1 Tax=Kineosphaera limosa NBRC 100340 TaxID=1184609 RepID=K6WZR5_9MICO|nr:NAD(P)-dependent alcohol dehydrogenase [Kineosphaera limosa]NYE01153.1 NADPH:quinone reductase-like Zn-dependent oxidoreductase [Kineosphaera limosa]GAB97612.1 putative oxidoreductase [Kineosphaera limosa NBRC 100340]
MRRIVQDGFGGTEQLRVETAGIPEPGTGQVSIRVGAVGVDRGTWHILTGTPPIGRLGFGLRRPRAAFRTPGRDVAGVIDALGPGVCGWEVGERVHGTADGSLADYVVTSVDRIARPAPTLNLVEAAALPISGLTAYQALRDAAVGPGQRVLVVGASGGVGHLAVQIAAALGAHTSAVCRAESADLMRALGASQIIERTSAALPTEAGPYDVVLDIASNRPRRELRALLTTRGTLVCIGTEAGGLTSGLHHSMAAALLNPFVSHRLVMHISKELGSDLAELDQLAEQSGVRPRVGHVVPFERAAEAIDLVGSGRAVGKTVVEVDGALWQESLEARASVATSTPPGDSPSSRPAPLA